MHNLKICHIHARSIYASKCHNKLDELVDVASVHSFDILCVTESWLNSNVDNSCIPLSGYSEPFRFDQNSHGGGIMAYMKRDLFCTHRRDLEQPGVEIMWLDFKLTHRNRLLIAVCYQPQIALLRIGSCFICVVLMQSTTF